MSLVRSKDHRTGITYVYESESYWDKEKQQPRAKRKLIGKIDEATGEIVPTDGRGRKRKNPKRESQAAAETVKESPDGFRMQLGQKDALITQLTEENRQLKSEVESLLNELGGILERHKTSDRKGN
ncbi:MAG: hypothetical protein LIO99_08400 [Clostridiales bacterium]|nr:hypothetical protein [Clostridiales bacterium]